MTLGNANPTWNLYHLTYGMLAFGLFIFTEPFLALGSTAGLWIGRGQAVLLWFQSPTSETAGSFVINLDSWLMLAALMLLAAQFVRRSDKSGQLSKRSPLRIRWPILCASAFAAWLTLVFMVWRQVAPAGDFEMTFGYLESRWLSLSWSPQFSPDGASVDPGAMVEHAVTSFCLLGLACTPPLLPITRRLLQLMLR